MPLITDYFLSSLYGDRRWCGFLLLPRQCNDYRVLTVGVELLVHLQNVLSERRCNLARL